MIRKLGKWDAVCLLSILVSLSINALVINERIGSKSVSRLPTQTNLPEPSLAEEPTALPVPADDSAAHVTTSQPPPPQATSSIEDVNTVQVPFKLFEDQPAFFELEGNIRPEVARYFGLSATEASTLNEMISAGIEEIRQSEKRSKEEYIDPQRYERQPAATVVVVPAQSEILASIALRVYDYLASVVDDSSAKLLTNYAILSRQLNDARYVRKFRLPHESGDGSWYNPKMSRGYSSSRYYREEYSIRWFPHLSTFEVPLQDQYRIDLVRYGGIVELPKIMDAR